MAFGICSYKDRSNRNTSLLNSPLLQELIYVRIDYIKEFLEHIIAEAKTATSAETAHAINKMDVFGPTSIIAAMARSKAESLSLHKFPLHLTTMSYDLQEAMGYNFETEAEQIKQLETATGRSSQGEHSKNSAIYQERGTSLG